MLSGEIALENNHYYYLIWGQTNLLLAAVFTFCEEEHNVVLSQPFFCNVHIIFYEVRSTLVNGYGHAKIIEV